MRPEDCIFEIRTQDDFEQLDLYEGRSVQAVLMNDIELTKSFKPFNWKGCFDGNGYRISGLDLRPEKIGDVSGVFASNYGTIKNLTVEGTIMPAENKSKGAFRRFRTHCSGGIAGYNTGKIINCKSFVDVTGAMYCGGIAGFCYGDIIDSETYGAITITEIDNASFIGNGYKLSQATGVIRDPKRIRNVKEYGVLEITDNNTPTGAYARWGTDGDSFKDILAHDPNPEYINNKGETYLHLLCQNDSLGSKIMMEMVLTLAERTNISFAAQDKKGRQATHYLGKWHENDIVKVIKSKIKEEKEFEFDDSFSTIGF